MQPTSILNFWNIITSDYVNGDGFKRCTVLRYTVRQDWYQTWTMTSQGVTPSKLKREEQCFPPLQSLTWKEQMSLDQSNRLHEPRRLRRGCWERNLVPPPLRSPQTAPRSEKLRNVSIGQRSLKCWSGHTWRKKKSGFFSPSLFSESRHFEYELHTKNFM